MITKPPEAIKTFVHLVDNKGWYKEIEYPGDFDCGNCYRERKRFNWKDLPVRKPLGPEPHNIPNLDFEFELRREEREILYDNFYYKHLYFQEK